MNFNADRLPSSTREIEWHWRQHIQESFNLSHININGNVVDFKLPSDYFEWKQRYLKLVKTKEPTFFPQRNEIKYAATGSGRRFTLASWGVRGHNRTLPDGRVIPVRPYRKGKDRKNPEVLVNKEYQFVEEKAWTLSATSSSFHFRTADFKGLVDLLVKTILHDQAVSLSNCNGKFRCHHRSYEEYPCGQ